MLPALRRDFDATVTRLPPDATGSLSCQNRQNHFDNPGKIAIIVEIMLEDSSHARRAPGGLGKLIPGPVLNWLPAMAVTLLFLSGTRSFGPGYDELIGEFQYGERSLSFLATGDWRYLQFEGPPPREMFREGHADLESPYLGYNDHGHAAAMVSAATCALLFRTLGWLPAVEAHHAGNVVFGVVLATVLFRVVRRVLGVGAAGWTLLFLLTQPRLLAHFYFNVKDFPETCLFALCVMLFWWGWTRGRARWLIAAGGLAGIAFVVKANILFLPAVVLPWAWYHQRLTTPPKGVSTTPRRIVVAMALMPLAALVGFYLTWPYLWTDPLGATWRYVSFIWQRAQSAEASTPFAALGAWLSATPEIVLAGVLAGLVFAVRETETQARSFLALAALWLLVPLARANLPGVQHHDGIRLFLEVTVPTAALAGWGIDQTVRRLTGWLVAIKPLRDRRSIVGIALGLVLVGSAVWGPARVYPYELAYFNRASGGLAGAQRRGDPDATDYWAASYRQGIAWINEQLPPQGVVAVPFAEHLVRYTRGAPGGLRDDLELLPLGTPFDREPVNGDLYDAALVRGPVTVMFVTRKSWYNAVIRHAQAHGRLVHSIRVEGAAVLEIYQVPRQAE